MYMNISKSDIESINETYIDRAKNGPRGVMGWIFNEKNKKIGYFMLARVDEEFISRQYY